MHVFTAYLNSNINIIFSIEVLNGCKIVQKICFLKKPIYQLKQLVC